METEISPRKIGARRYLPGDSPLTMRNRPWTRAERAGPPVFTPAAADRLAVKTRPNIRSRRWPAWCPTRSAAGSVGDVVEVDVLEDGIEVIAGRVRLRAELRRRQLVLDIEHGLAVVAGQACRPGRGEVALPVLPALLVDGEVEVRLEVIGLAEVVFEADGEASLCARLAIAASNCSWVAALMVSPVLFW